MFPKILFITKQGQVDLALNSEMRDIFRRSRYPGGQERQDSVPHFESHTPVMCEAAGSTRSNTTEEALVSDRLSSHAMTHRLRRFIALTLRISPHA